MINLGRIPPQNIEAERSLLGCILVESTLMDEVLTEIQASDFYSEKHKVIFEAMTALNASKTEIDINTLSNALSAKLEAIGGYEYIVELTNVVISAGWKNSLDIVKEKSIQRQLIITSTEIIDNCYENKDVEDTLNKAELNVMNINAKKTTQNVEQIDKLMYESLKRLEQRTVAKSSITGLPTGLRDLDYKLAGLQNTDLIIVAARPAMGKTSLAINIVENVGIVQKKPAMVFSMEMGNEQLTDRIICSQAEVDSHKYKIGKLTDVDWEKLRYPTKRIAEAPIYIDDTPGISINQIRAKARKQNQKTGLSLIVIDYLQLMAKTGTGSRNDDISEKTRSIKILAKELKVPVILLSQLSRGCEAREDKRPMLSDLRDSGAIEQDADIVMFLYRDEYYNPQSNDKGLAECIVAKHRSGSTGTVMLKWQGEYTKFSNVGR